MLNIMQVPKSNNLLLSIFCGAGGLDKGFEDAFYDVGLAFDIREDSIKSYNHNRERKCAHVADVRDLTLKKLDNLYGAEFRPIGVIGGPPCQSFSRANVQVKEGDPRHELILIYADIIVKLHRRSPLSFFVFENVTGLKRKQHVERLGKLQSKLGKYFNLTEAVLNAKDYGVPQSRERLFIVGVSKKRHKDVKWQPPEISSANPRTVKMAIGDLPMPTFFAKDLSPETIPYHPNHWCMNPKSPRFKGALREGDGNKRSFKVLSWNAPSITVAYGHREVHVHPNCDRRLSVLEAMLLQGFPFNYQLCGSLSSQITQVSEAVPPPLAKEIADSICKQLSLFQQPAPDAHYGWQSIFPKPLDRSSQVLEDASYSP